MVIAAIARRQQGFAFGFGIFEMLEQEASVGIFEIMPRIFLLGLQKHIAIGDTVGAL